MLKIETPAARVVRPLKSLTNLRVATYNMLNLYDHNGSYETNHEGRRIWVERNFQKNEKKRAAQARAIVDEDPDILLGQEVDGLSKFSREYLDNRYQELSLPTNDTRAVQMGILVKRDLPFDYVLRSHAKELWRDPTEKHADESLLFSRDFTALEIREAGAAPDSRPLMIVFNTHFKSMRNRDRDPKSAILRRAQVQRSFEIVTRYKSLYGADVPLIFGGDLNAPASYDSAFTPLWRYARFEDAFNLLENIPSRIERTTHSFHPEGTGRVYTQLDYILLSPHFHESKALNTAYVHRYEDEQGALLPLPRTHAEREALNPSDHYMVVVDFDIQKLLAL